jgi:putative tryptophan/tyrosine transport system substrate-binding protein
MLLRLFALLMLLAGSARADIILLASDDKGAVAASATALQLAYSGRVEVHNLGGSRRREDEVIRAIKASPVSRVVAVGLLAAQVARQRLDGKQVVFCQVLNIDESNLIAPWMKGVSGIPSLTRQFAAWKTLDPNLRKIGLITGGHAGYMVSEAEAAAKSLGLEIEHVSVSSDRAVMSALQELRERRIQGLWLAPDSSILNQRTILDLMAYSVRHHLPVLAFSPTLLKEGALLSGSADTGEIVAITLERLRKAAGNATIPGEALAPLAGARITVSAAAAARFGLAIPARLKEQVDVE